MRDYWRDCIADAFEESKIDATDEQIDNVTAWVEGAHENYGMAVGHDVARANLASERRRETERLEREIAREQAKVTCRECSGTGWIHIQGPHHGSTSQCWKCRGAGRHDL